MCRAKVLKADFKSNFKWKFCCVHKQFEPFKIINWISKSSSFYSVLWTLIPIFFKCLFLFPNLLTAPRKLSACVGSPVFSSLVNCINLSNTLLYTPYNILINCINLSNNLVYTPYNILVNSINLSSTMLYTPYNILINCINLSNTQNKYID